ncbi:hypothetical protein GCM10010302_78200 [Streptomyces polychromogenes]|uniref:Secreted protein n=1 Tax=Streptomyces polychromogenes TaxID=67342 RepID=A0ABN0W747_9ACTN
MLLAWLLPLSSRVRTKAAVTAAVTTTAEAATMATVFVANGLPPDGGWAGGCCGPVWPHGWTGGGVW